MKIAKLVPFAVALALLAGCAPTKEQYEAAAVALQGSNKARQETIRQCMAGWDATARRNAALVIDSSEKDAPRLVCNRLVTAIASGRLTYADAMGARNGNFTPKVVKILQGR